MPNSSSHVDLSAFERLLTDISTRFVNAAAANVDAEITGALRSLVEFLGVDRSTLFQWSADGRNLEITHHWVVAGCEPVPQFIPQEVLPYLLRKTLEGKPFSYSSLAELPPEAAVDRKFLEKHGPKSNLSFPLVAGGSAVGALAFGTLRHEREWPEVLKDRLCGRRARLRERARAQAVRSRAAARLRGGHAAQGTPGARQPVPAPGARGRRGRRSRSSRRARR